MKITTLLNPVIRKIVVGQTRSSPGLVFKDPITDGVRNLLSTPTWSVRSLLPDASPSPPQSSQQQEQTPTISASQTDRPQPGRAGGGKEDEITPSKLQHLLRLSALPPPSSPKEEASLLKSLQTHLHFVRAIQSVDTTGVEPLVTIRDETDAGIDEATIKLADLQPFLDQEEKVGQNGTVRRRGKIDMEDAETAGLERKKAWEIDVWRLGDGAETRRKGNYFYVKKEQKHQQEIKNKQDSILAGGLD